MVLLGAEDRDAELVVTLVTGLEEDVRDLDDVDEGEETEKVFCVLDVFRDELVSLLLFVDVKRVEEDGNGFDDEAEEDVPVFCDEVVDFWVLLVEIDEDLAIVLEDDDGPDFEEVDVNLVALDLWVVWT